MFTMLNKQDMIFAKFRKLGLNTEEAKIYIELLKAPNTHLQLSRSTSINRTKVYRLVDDLEKRSLITRRTDDRGTFLVASDPKTLEVELVTEEGKLKTKRLILDQLLPTLETL